MQLSQRQYQTLSELDIPVWQRRQVVADATIETVAEPQPALTVDLSSPVWLVSASATFNDEEARLLNAMLKAIGLSRHGIALLEYEQIKAVNDADMADKTILLLGAMNDIMPTHAKITQPEVVMHSAGSRWLMTYSLKDMLQNTRLKATAWQALKLFQE